VPGPCIRTIISRIENTHASSSLPRPRTGPHHACMQLLGLHAGLSSSTDRSPSTSTTTPPGSSTVRRTLLQLSHMATCAQAGQPLRASVQAVPQPRSSLIGIIANTKATTTPRPFQKLIVVHAVHHHSRISRGASTTKP